jgi:hypothetical protein
MMYYYVAAGHLHVQKATNTVTHHRQNLLECNWISSGLSRIVSFGIKVHLLYEPGYVISSVANITKENPVQIQQNADYRNW